MAGDKFCLGDQQIAWLNRSYSCSGKEEGLGPPRLIQERLKKDLATTATNVAIVGGFDARNEPFVEVSTHRTLRSWCKSIWFETFPSSMENVHVVDSLRVFDWMACPNFSMP